jgi:Tol biopolymer transport system component
MCTRASIDDAFGPPVNLGPTINASGNEEHPSISSDGKTLWFSSPRDGGFGHYDIWYSKRVKKRAAKLATSESGKSSASTTASRQFAVPAAETDAPTSPKN